MIWFSPLINAALMNAQDAAFTENPLIWSRNVCPSALLHNQNGTDDRFQTGRSDAPGEQVHTIELEAVSMRDREPVRVGAGQ